MDSCLLVIPIWGQWKQHPNNWFWSIITYRPSLFLVPNILTITASSSSIPWRQLHHHGHRNRHSTTHFQSLWNHLWNNSLKCPSNSRVPDFPYLGKPGCLCWSLYCLSGWFRHVLCLEGPEHHTCCYSQEWTISTIKRKLHLPLWTSTSYICRCMGQWKKDVQIVFRLEVGQENHSESYVK